MPEATGGSAGGSAASAPGSAPAGDVGQTGVGSLGNAPDSGQDAATGGLAQDSSAQAQQVAEFLFRGRQWKSREHAENAMEAMLGRLPETQRQNELFQRQIAERDSELQALRALVNSRQGTQRGQGREDEREAAASLADELAKSGELDFIQQIAENPEMGQKHALYALTQAIEKRMEARQQSLIQEHIQPLIMERETSNALTSSLGAARQLAEHFPEIDPDNSSPEAQEAQQGILEIVKQLFSPDKLVENPAAVLGTAAMLYREMNGAPVFAQPPGSSGSPSAFAAGAAEAAAGGPTPLDGNGVPRPGTGGHSPLDRMRRENREINSKVVKTPSGRPLFPTN